MAASVGGVPQSIAALAAKGTLASLALLGNSFKKTASIATTALGSINKSLQSNVSNIGNLGKGISGLGNTFTGLAATAAIAGAAIALPFLGLKNALSDANESSKDFLNTVGTIMGITDSSFELASQKMLAYKKVVSETATSIGVDAGKANRLVTATIDDLILISTNSNGFINEAKIKDNIASLTLLSSKMSEQDMMFAQKGLNKFLDPKESLNKVLQYDFFTNVGLTPVIRKQLREQKLDFDKLNRNERAALLQSVIKSTTGQEIIKAQARLISSQLEKFKTELFDADFGKFGFNRKITTSNTTVTTAAEAGGLALQGAADVANSTDSLIKALGFIADPMVVIAEKFISLRTFFDGIAKSIDVVTKGLPKDVEQARQKVLELVQKKIFESIKGVGSFLRTEFTRFATFITSPQVTGFIGGVITATGKLISDAAKTLTEDIKKINLGIFLSEKLAQLTNWIRTAIFSSETGNIGNSVFNLLGALATAITDFIGNTFTNFIEFINSYEGTLFISNVLSGLYSVGTSIVRYIGRAFSSVASFINSEQGQQYKAQATAALTDVGSALGGSIQSLGKSILGLAIKGVASIINFLDTNDIGKMGADKANSVISDLSNFFKSDQGVQITGGLGKLIGSFVNVLTRFVSKLDFGQVIDLVTTIVFPLVGSALKTLDWGALFTSLFKVAVLYAVPGLITGLGIMLGWSLIAIGVGISALVLVIAANWQDIKEDFVSNWSVIQKNFGKFIDWLDQGIRWIGSEANKLKDNVVRWFNQYINTAFSNAIRGIGDRFKSWGSDIQKGWQDTVNNWNNAWAAIGDGIANFVNAIKDKLSFATNFLGGSSTTPAQTQTVFAPSPAANLLADTKAKTEQAATTSRRTVVNSASTTLNLGSITPSISTPQLKTPTSNIPKVGDAFGSSTPTGSRAKGNYPSIYQALVAEMSAAPIGATPVVANSSELIIPQKDIKSFINNIKSSSFNSISTASEGNVSNTVINNEPSTNLYLNKLFENEFRPLLTGLSKILSSKDDKLSQAVYKFIDSAKLSQFGGSNIIDESIPALGVSSTPIITTSATESVNKITEAVMSQTTLIEKLKSVPPSSALVTTEKEDVTTNSITEILKTVTSQGSAASLLGSIQDKAISIFNNLSKDKETNNISSILKTVTGGGSIVEKITSVIGSFTKDKESNTDISSIVKTITGEGSLPEKAISIFNNLTKGKFEKETNTASSILKTVTGEGSLPEKLLSIVGLFNKDKEGKPKEGGTVSTVADIAKTVMGEGSLPEKLLSVVNLFSKDKDGEQKEGGTISTISNIANTVMGQGSIQEKLFSVVDLFNKDKEGKPKEGGTLSTISNVAKTVMGEGTLVEKAMSIFNTFTSKGQDKDKPNNPISNPISNLIQNNAEKYRVGNVNPPQGVGTSLQAAQSLIPPLQSPLTNFSTETNLNTLYKDVLQSQNIGNVIKPFLNVPSVEERKNDEKFTTADSYGIKPLQENNEPLFNPIGQTGEVNNTSNVGGDSKQVTINAYFNPTINNAGQGAVENLEGQFGQFQAMLSRAMSEGIGAEH